MNQRKFIAICLAFLMLIGMASCKSAKTNSFGIKNVPTNFKEIFAGKGTGSDWSGGWVTYAREGETPRLDNVVVVATENSRSSDTEDNFYSFADISNSPVFDVEGHPAVFNEEAPATHDRTYILAGALYLLMGKDSATTNAHPPRILISSLKYGSKSELVNFAKNAKLGASEFSPPSIDAPAGFTKVGTSEVGIIGYSSIPDKKSEGIDAESSARAVVWRHGKDLLVASKYPHGVGDYRAFLGLPLILQEKYSDDSVGKQVIFHQSPSQSRFEVNIESRIFVTNTRSGGLLVIEAYGNNIPSVSQLKKMADSEAAQ